LQTPTHQLVGFWLLAKRSKNIKKTKKTKKTKLQTPTHQLEATWVLQFWSLSFLVFLIFWFFVEKSR